MMEPRRIHLAESSESWRLGAVMPYGAMAMPPTLAAVLAAAVAAVVILVFRSERKRAKEKAAMLAANGFQPLAQPDPELRESLLSLFRRGREARRPLKLRTVFHRESPAGRLAVFDVLDPKAGRGGGGIAFNAVGVVRRGMGLPAFEVVAYSEQGGAFGKLMVTFTGSLLGLGRAVPFDDLPEFARRFTVLLPQGAEEAAVRAYLTPGIRQALLECRFQLLTAGGDAFALQPNPTGPQRVAGENQLLRDLVEEALRLAPVLAGSGL
jgi:hypothetical protein